MRLLNFSDNDEPFATGAARYRYDTVPGSGDASRIILQVEVEGETVEAILDTGGGYFFCNPALAERIGADPTNALEDKWISIKKEMVKGSLHRIEITFLNDCGENLTIQATAFLPDHTQNFDPNFLPYSYLGMLSCMERMRFAIDPSEDNFYFGASSS